MIVTTKSGAVYMIDTEKPAAQRQGTYSPDINYTLVPDGEWVELEYVPEVRVGESVYMSFVNGTLRITTPVVSIEEV